jgi:hypothetical protein
MGPPSKVPGSWEPGTSERPDLTRSNYHGSQLFAGGVVIDGRCQDGAARREVICRLLMIVRARVRNISADAARIRLREVARQHAHLLQRGLRHAGG